MRSGRLPSSSRGRVNPITVTGAQQGQRVGGGDIRLPCLARPAYLPPALMLPANLWLMDKSPGQLAMGMTYKVAAVYGTASKRVACSEGKRTRRCGQLQRAQLPEQFAKMVRNYPAQEFSEVSTPQSVYLLPRDLLLLLLHI